MWRADPIINVLPAGGGTPAWVNGLFILGGALGGGGLAYISSWRSDKRRDSTEAKLAFDQLKAQDDRRWDGPIRDHVAKYHGTTMALAAAAEEARARFPQLFGRDPSDPYKRPLLNWQSFNFRKEILDRLFVRAFVKSVSKATAENGEAYSQLMLVAPRTLMAAVDELLEASQALATVSLKASDLPNVEATYTEKRLAMIDSARLILKPQDM